MVCRLRTGVVLVVAAACASSSSDGSRARSSSQDGAPRASSACSFDVSPTVLARDGTAILQMWIVADSDVWGSAVLPDDADFLAYRRAIEGAGAALRRPVADPPQPATDAERALWDAEARNVDVAFSGRAGEVRPVRCLDALLFATQNARYSQLSHPTEFIAAILRRRDRGRDVLKIYFTAGDMMFPPPALIPTDRIRQDRSAGWTLEAILHNHTVQTYRGRPALGVPAPSTSDVDLLRSLASGMGLQGAWVTNGFYTVEIPAALLDAYEGR